jgi:choline monooxygenase
MKSDRSFAIDPDIRVARTLPGWVYTDADVHAAQRERLFARAWHYAGHDGLVKNPGQVHPFTILDEPLLLTRDVAGLHAISNVCTHRGTIVVESPCRATHLRCRYHGRTFALDGRFASMPEFEGAANFPSPADHLPKVGLGHWRGFLLASLAPAVPFDELVSPMRDRLAPLPFDRLAFAGSRDFEVKANWALYVDNYLEGFHIPFVHAGLASAIDYGSYATEPFPHGVLQVAKSKAGEASFDGGIAAYYYWLFPGTMFNVYPWGISVNAVTPLAVDRTRVTFQSFVWDASKREKGAGAGLDRVEAEDEAVVESVQRGVKSRLYDRGRYSPTRETGVHHFHRLLADILNRP